MTINGYCEKARFRHSDKAPGRNLDALALSLDQEQRQILALERRTGFSFGERRTIQRQTGLI
jgi:hypothetical protein